MEKHFSSPTVAAWLQEWTDRLGPERVELVTGEPAQQEGLVDLLISRGSIVRLDPVLRPNSFLALSDSRDVARLESRTFICSEQESDAGPTNNWRSPSEMKAAMLPLYEGAMRGRTLYVVPFAMGPEGSRFQMLGIELTDSAYVALSMTRMARVSKAVAEAIDQSGDFVPAVHSVGVPLAGREDVPWPCNPESTYVAHFPETREIWSFGSGYGGNALLGKKCLALRIGSVVGKREGWLAEHMLILKLTSPAGKVYYVAGAFPSACGKTNLAMLVPTVPGWKAETVGDYIAWIRRGEDGRLYAVNPEAGFFGVAPGTSVRSNAMAMQTISRDTIFTNCALTREGDVWWEGATETPPDGLIDWKGLPWDGQGPAAHPNARFTVPASKCPMIAPEWQDPAGVPLSALLLGGRRSDLIPLVTEARSWEHGVFLGSIMASETTAAAEGPTGKVRRDPFAMLPFCGYNIGDYFQHWLDFGAETKEGLPRIYLVNWFRRNADRKYIWPGYGDNVRVLSWIIDRLEGRAAGRETPLGVVPAPGEIDLAGTSLSAEEFAPLVEIDRADLAVEIEDVKGYYANLGERLPSRLRDELEELHKRV